MTNENVVRPQLFLDINHDEIARRMTEARQVFDEHPDLFSPQTREAILAQRVMLGMTPYEAYLAAGAFMFRVIADQDKWPDHIDPYRVMWAQSLSPDRSQIWMTFQTHTQCPGDGAKTFRVSFENGKAKSIEQLSTQGDR